VQSGFQREAVEAPPLEVQKATERKCEE
jgi:hypothetical protein